MLVPLALLGLGILYVASRGTGGRAVSSPANEPQKGPAESQVPTSGAPASGSSDVAAWFTPTISAVLSPEAQKKREDGVVAILKRANETGSKVLVSFLLRRSGAPTIAALAPYEAVAYGLVQSVTPGSPRGYIVSTTSYGKRSPGGVGYEIKSGEIVDLPPVGSKFAIDDNSLLSIKDI